jgi:hypothetical protein
VNGIGDVRPDGALLARGVVEGGVSCTTHRAARRMLQRLLTSWHPHDRCSHSCRGLQGRHQGLLC